MFTSGKTTESDIVNSKVCQAVLHAKRIDLVEQLDRIVY